MHFIYFQLVGLILVVIGAIAKIDQSLLMQFFSIIPSEIADEVTGVWDFGSFLTSGAYLLITVGVVMCVVGFCGGCGALKESKWLIASVSTT